MFVFNTSLATAESLTAIGAMYTTNATANTVTDHIRFLTGAAKGIVTALSIVGRGAGLTALSGIAVRMLRMATASTAGTAASIRDRSGAATTAVMTAFTAPTIGATPTLALAIGCGAAGPGGWAAMNPDAGMTLAQSGGANGNIDMVSGSGTVSLGFDATVEHME